MSAAVRMLERGRYIRIPFVAKDPRLLILVFLAVVFGTFMVARPTGLILLLAYLVTLLTIAGTVRALMSQARTILLFIVIIVGVNGFFADGRPLPGVLSFLSIDGIVVGLYYSLRVLVLFAAMAFLMSVAAPESLAAGIASFVSPLSSDLARRIALYAFVSLGFLPLFADEITRVKAAQGFRSKSGGFLGSIAGTRLLVVPLIVSAVRRSAQLAMAVEVRGIKGSIDRILVVPGPSHRDVAFVVVTALVLTGAVLL